MNTMKLVNQSHIKAHRGILLVVALSLVVLAVFAFLWIMPAFKTIEALEGRIADLTFKIERQTKLSSVYLQLKNRKKVEIPQVLRSSEKSKLAKSELNSVLSVVQKTAEATEFSVLKVNPDMAALEKTPEQITVEAVIRGSFLTFRDFLFEIARVPYLQGIEEIFITSAGADKEITMKLMIAIK